MNMMQRFRKSSSVVMTAVLATSILPSALWSGGTAHANVPGCTTSLTMTGNANVPVTSIERNQVEMITINYLIDPNGTRTVTSTRPPNDVVFVADKSGSMDYRMDTTKGASTSNPKRMDILKDASKVLIDNFKENNYDNLGLVKFSTDAEPAVSVGKSYQTVQDQINLLSPNGSTNIDEALTDAKTLLDASVTTNPKQIILLTDGAATAWTNNKGKVSTGDTVQSADEARAHGTILKNAGIKVYTIALATEGSSEIDLPLLQSIADTTGGRAFRASSVAELEAIFDNITTVNQAQTTLSNVVLRQPIPEGFILAPDKNAANVVYNSTTKMIEVNLGDIPYPFVQDNYPISVNLIPDTAAGNYKLADATVSYTNECNSPYQFPITMGMDLSVSLRIRDMYGNVYLANKNSTPGQVQRVRKDEGPDSLQWTIRELDSAVTDIRFESTDSSRLDDSIVHVYYRNGQEKIWDLKPTAPNNFELRDANNNVIADLGWHKGPGKISSISGSENQLPASTVYANEDFMSGYIAGYESSINGGDWSTFNSSTGITLPDGNGVGFKARAFTNAISGSSNQPIPGAMATGNVSLDSSGPVISWSKDIQNPTDDGTIYITATDNLSPVTGIKVWFDNRSTSITSSSPKMVKNGNTYSFKLSDVPGFSDAQKRYGWHQIEYEATSAGGTTSSAPDYFVVNPGPSANLRAVDYNEGDIADKPVNLVVEDVTLPVTDRTFSNGHKEYGFTLKGMYYVIKENSNTPTAAEWKTLAAKKLTVTTKTSSTTGTYYVHFKLVDSSGIENVYSPKVIQFDTEQNNN